MKTYVVKVKDTKIIDDASTQIQTIDIDAKKIIGGTVNEDTICYAVFKLRLASYKAHDEQLKNFDAFILRNSDNDLAKHFNNYASYSWINDHANEYAKQYSITENELKALHATIDALLNECYSETNNIMNDLKKGWTFINCTIMPINEDAFIDDCIFEHCNLKPLSGASASNDEDGYGYYALKYRFSDCSFINCEYGMGFKKYAFENCTVNGKEANEAFANAHSIYKQSANAKFDRNDPLYDTGSRSYSKPSIIRYVHSIDDVDSNIAESISIAITNLRNADFYGKEDYTINKLLSKAIKAIDTAFSANISAGFKQELQQMQLKPNMQANDDTKNLLIDLYYNAIEP